MRLPKWFTAVFVIWMAVCAVALSGCLVQRAGLEESLQSARTDLTQNRGREAKQSAEYNEAVEALPGVQAELEALAPEVAEVTALEAQLREQRKTLRAENTALSTALADEQAALLALRTEAAAAIGLPAAGEEAAADE